MSDESPYRPTQITIPDGHPLLNTDGYSDALAQCYANLPPLKAAEPIKLTQDQLDAIRAASKPAPAGAALPILGTPIIIVEHVEESTPYRRLLEKQLLEEQLKRAAKAAMKISYPKPQLPGPFENQGY